MRVVLVAGLLAVLTAGASSGPVMAHHAGSYYPLYFWDFNDDGIPDPDVTFWAVGESWSTPELDRVGEAMWQWRNYSAFNPILDRSNANDPPYSSTPFRRVWVDGTYSSHPPCGGDFPDGGVLAYVCIESYAARTIPGGLVYYRLLKMGMYFNDTPSYPWYYGTGTTPDNQADFKGVAAHESGHLGVLIHVPFAQCDYPGPGMFTMCQGYVGTSVEIDTMRWRTIEPDDISSAGVIY